MTYKLCDSEYRFMQVVWDAAPVSSPALVELCQEKLGWKKSTTYTVLKKLCGKGLLKTWKVTTVNLMREDLRPLSGEFFAGREELLQTGKIDDVRFDRARQLAAADLVVIAAPFWDMSFPALLKIYIENVSVEGITFRGTEEGLRGLCRAERCVFLTTRGAAYAPGDPMEQALPYLRAIQKFFGFGALDCVAADGLDLDGADADALVAEACARAAALAETL